MDSSSNTPRHPDRKVTPSGNRFRPLTLAMGGLLAAVVFVSTAFLKLPIPMAQGYVHLGDGFILLGAALMGYVAVPAAALGSLLADLLLGFVPYALPTFVIKGAMAAVAVLAVRQKNIALRILLLILAEAVMVFGYFVAEGWLLGLGAAGAWASVPGNAVQGGSGVVIALALMPMLRRIKLK
ncbi:MAG: ECF transporter S component [Candidatus Limiplasma sp.]|nr:ECF transporter S component [Candidatus Limiplasma sp.]